MSQQVIRRTSWRAGAEFVAGPVAAYPHRRARTGARAARRYRGEHASQRAVSVRRHLRHGLLRYGQRRRSGCRRAEYPGVSVTIVYLVRRNPVYVHGRYRRDGLYEFGTGFPQGEWTIAAQTPPGTTPSPADQGGDDAADSDGTQVGPGNSVAKLTWDGTKPRTRPPTSASPSRGSRNPAPARPATGRIIPRRGRSDRLTSAA